MKKRKQKQRFKGMEKRPSDEGMDLMEAYIERPPKEEVKTVSSLQRCTLTCKTHDCCYSQMKKKSWAVWGRGRHFKAGYSVYW